MSKATRLVVPPTVAGLAFILALIFAANEPVRPPHIRTRIPELSSPIPALVIDTTKPEPVTHPPGLTENPSATPTWAVPFGREFWRNSRGKDDASTPTHGAPANIDVGGAIERVRHALVVNAESNDARVKAKTFEAKFGRPGISFRPASNNRTPEGASSARDLDVGFHTAAIRRGEHALVDEADHDAGWFFRGNTAQRPLAAGAIVEHFEVMPQGVAVTWVLTTPPPGDGPLFVEAELTGATYAGETRQGHHFADTAGTARVRLGEITAVDSSGRHWPVTTTVEQSRLKVSVPESVLLAAAYPLALDPWISPEFGMDKPVLTAAAFEQLAPRVASNGNIHLVVWRDVLAVDQLFRSEIRGARVSSTGEVLDPAGFTVSTETDQVAEPSAAAVAGGDFLIVWTQGAGGSTVVNGALVQPAGTVRKRVNVASTSADNYAGNPTVTAGGDGFLVPWIRTPKPSGAAELRASRVTLDGDVTDPGGFVVSASPNMQNLPVTAAFNGHDYLVAWTQFAPAPFGYDVYAARVSTAGVTRDGNGIAVSHSSGDQFSPAVASAGDDFLVVWADQRKVAGDLVPDVYGCRVSAAGTALDPDGFPIAVLAQRQTSPAVASDGNQYLVAWTDRRADGFDKVYGARVTQEGVVRDPDGVRISGTGDNNDSPAICAASEGFLVVWRQDIDVSRDDVVGAFFPANGGPIPPGTQFLVSRGPNLQLAPAVAANGANYLITWQDNRNQGLTGQDIYGVRLAPDGTILDPDGIPICVDPGDQSSPAVGASGSTYLITWRDERDAAANQDDIYGRLLRGTGVLGPEPFPICTVTNSQRAPAVAGGADGFFVAWRDSRNPVSTTATDIFGTLVRLTGQVVTENGGPISSAIYDQQAPVVASNGSGYFVAWRDSRNELLGSGDDIFGALVTGDGVVGTEFSICTEPGTQRAPDVAANGSTYLVTWRDDRKNNKVVPHIHGARVTEADGVLDPDGVALSTAANEQREPAVAATNRGWFVAWQDNRNFGVTGWNVFGAGVGFDGKPVAGSELLLTADRLNLDVLALASRGGNELLLVSEGVRGDASRTVARLIELTDVAPSLAIAAQGASVRLRWPLSPRFPAKATSIVSSSALDGWIPLADTFQPAIGGDGLTAELEVPVDSAVEARKFFRLHSD